MNEECLVFENYGAKRRKKLRVRTPCCKGYHTADDYQPRWLLLRRVRAGQRPTDGEGRKGQRETRAQRRTVRNQRATGTRAAAAAATVLDDGRVRAADDRVDCVCTHL